MDEEHIAKCPLFGDCLVEVFEKLLLMRGSCGPGPELSTMFHRCALTYTIYERGRTCKVYTSDNVHIFS